MCMYTFFLRKSDCLGCAVLLCLVVCLTLLASFFLPSHLSLKHIHVHYVCVCVCVCVCMVCVWIHGNMALAKLADFSTTIDTQPLVSMTTDLFSVHFVNTGYSVYG